MRRKRKNKLKVFILILIILSLSMSYALLSSSINIVGIVSGNNSDNYIVDKDSNPNLTMGTISQNQWQENNEYRKQIRFPIQNISNDPLDNFQLTITFDTEILSISIWNFEYVINGKNLVIKSNNIINPNQNIEINFIIGVNKENLKINKIKFEVDTHIEELDPNLFTVNFSISNGWGNYTYQYNVTVQNNTDKQISYWQININSPDGTNYISGWNGIFSTNNNILIVKNASYNGKLNPNQSTTFGLQISTNVQNFIPDNYTVVVR